MSEDVKIRLKFEQEGANAFAETKAKIEQLYKAAAAYEGKGMDTAAKSARSEAKSLEKDLARDAKEREAAEKKISSEVKQRASEERKAAKEQEAVDKARMSMFQRATRHAAGAVEGAAGGSPLGGIGSMLGGPAGIALQIGAAVTAVAASFARQAHEEKLIDLRADAARTMQNFDMQRMAGVDGSSSAARADAIAARREVLERQQDRARIDEDNKPQWWNPASWMRHLTGADQNAKRENEKAITLAEQRGADEDKNTRTQFARDGEKEIEIAEKRARGEMASAKAAEMALKYHRDIVKLKREGATDEEAFRGADANFASEMRGRDQSLAGLINSRTGAADAARIASMGDRQFSQARDSVAAQKIQEQTQLMKEQHQDGTNVATRPSFSSPPLHS